MNEIEVVYKRVGKSGRATLLLSSRGAVTVRYGARVPLLLAKLFFQKHKKSLEEKLIKQRNRSHSLAKEYELDERLFKNHEGEELALYKANALALVLGNLPKMAEKLSLSYERVSIKKTSSRWGSCSSKRNLNFHYKILFLPEPLFTYLLAHELCHLREMNHGPLFWKHVEEICPEYKKLRKDLRGLSP